MNNTQSLEPVLEDLRQGKMVLLQDDPTREDEGDLVMAAEHITAEDANFMAKQARGLMCVPMTEERAEALKLRRMIPEKRDRIAEPGFTVSVDARDGITTGISAPDRAKTVRVLADDQSQPDDLRRPGHVFPLIARDEGVFVRRGQTEGSVDLLKLAGLKPIAAICEVMNDDGTMASDEDFERFCSEHDIKRCSISDIVRYRTRNESILDEKNRKEISTQYGTFELRTYVSRLDECVYRTIIADDDNPSFSDNGDVPPVLIHKKCIEGHIFQSDDCECRQILTGMLQTLGETGAGALVCWSKTERHVPADPHSPLERFTGKSEASKGRTCVREEIFDDRYVCWNTANILQEIDMNPVKLITDQDAHAEHLEQMGATVKQTMDVDRIKSRTTPDPKGSDTELKNSAPDR